MVRPRDPSKTLHVDRVLSAVETGRDAARSSIAASWMRSYKQHQLAPDAIQGRRCETSELAERQDRAGRLMRIAAPTMDRLFATLQLAGCSIVLCDADGVILKTRQRDGDAVDFGKAGLNTGADWSERSQGTNGIGTCIAEQRAATILRDQHFHADKIGMSCFGVPVFDSHGRLQAVLDVSTCRDGLDPALGALIGRAVQDAAVQMESDYFCDEYADLRIIHGLQADGSAPRLLAVDAYDLVVGATRSARRHYGLPLGSDLNPVPAADLLGDAQDRGVGLEGAERRELKRALARAGGNMSAAARALGVSRATLYRRASKAGLIPSSGES